MRDWEKANDDDPLLFKKELLPCGEFIRWVGDDKTEIPIRVRREFLDKVVRDFQTFKKNRVRVPLFKTHNTDPDNERGLVEDVFVEQNDYGVDSLFATIKFHNAKHAEQGKNNDVSVYCPKRYKDATTQEYTFPLRHVALTSDPIIPGLSKFEPMVLSFDPAQKLGDPMTELIDSILVAMNIEVPDGVDDQAKLQLILKNLANPQALATAPETPAVPAAGGLNLSFTPVMVKQFSNLRSKQIEQLVPATITAAMADKLKKQFCSQEALEADLTLSADESASGETEFDRTIALLEEQSKSPTLKPSGRRAATPAEKDMSLGHDGTGKSPMVENMRKRREAANNKR